MQAIRNIAAMAALLLPCTILGQAPAITSVENSISGDGRLSPGVVARVRYAPFTAADLKNYESVSVHVGGYAAWVTEMSEDSSGGGIVTAVLPRQLAPGAADLTLTISRGTSAPFRIALNEYSPAFHPPSTKCDNGSQIGVLSGVGLGATNPPSPDFGYPPLGQAFPTVAMPAVTVAGIPAEVRSSLGSPPGGEYQITFKVAPETPEGAVARM